MLMNAKTHEGLKQNSISCRPIYVFGRQITEGKALVQKIYDSSSNKGKLRSIAGTCLNNLTLYYYDNKDYEKALSLCREALVFLPNHYKARLKLVRLLFELNAPMIQATSQHISPHNKDMTFHLFVTLAKQYAEAYRH